jgi:hypothetical protein
MGELHMAKYSFDRPFVIKDDEAALRFIEASRHPAPPPSKEVKAELREMMERGEAFLEKWSSRSKKQ